MFFENKAQSRGLCIPIQKAQEWEAGTTGVSHWAIHYITDVSVSVPNKRLSPPGKKGFFPAERKAVLDSFELCIVGMQLICFM